MAGLRALVAKWDADPAMHDNVVNTEKAVGTLIVAEKGSTAAADQITDASIAAIISAE